MQKAVMISSSRFSEYPSKEINDYIKKGWRVVAMTSTGERGLVVVLEKDKEE